MKAWRRTSPAGRALLGAVLFTSLTGFMFMPLLAIELTARNLTPGLVGLLVGLLAFSGQAFSLAAGLLADRFGTRPVMAAGFLLRIIGYPMLAFGGADRISPLVTGVIAVGVGGALMGLSIKTLLVSEDGPSPRDMLALRATFINIGVVAGPALGALVYPLGFPYILAACVASHLALAVRLALLRAGTVGPRPVPPGTGAEPGAGAGSGRAALWAWTPLFLLGAAYGALYGQLNIVLPLSAAKLTGNETAISVVFIVNGALVVICQFALLSRVFHRAAARTLLTADFLSFALAYAALLPLAGWWSLLVFVFPVTLAEMLIGPSLDEQAVRMGTLRRTGLALGAMSASNALGGLIGSTAGGYLIQVLGVGVGLYLVIIVTSAVSAGGALFLPKGARQPV
ncbi:MFS transporter [Bailinhaonella thermotolerans]|uniref:MFS transporter n=1 Tax=Bailinhaonella thermotolerans TaxID=1070861 RepID=A0A3A4AW81_9ACTN|nr:MFS transporter [Bailinhaonella thermotolerans]RJL30113.1 MFS transporter [Bailinhaonella thermotolerans]